MSVTTRALERAIRRDEPVSDSALLVGATKIIDAQALTICRLGDQLELANAHADELRRQNSYLRSRMTWTRSRRAS